MPVIVSFLYLGHDSPMPFCFKTSSRWTSWCLALQLLLGHKKDNFSEVYFWLVFMVGREQSCIQVSRGVGRHKRVSSLPPPNHLNSEIEPNEMKSSKKWNQTIPSNGKFNVYLSYQLYAKMCHTQRKWIKKKVNPLTKFCFHQFCTYQPMQCALHCNAILGPLTVQSMHWLYSKRS